jgi:putative DNA primase/helicase
VDGTLSSAYDRDPSLAITNARNGRVLVHCHAGCDQQDVFAALRACGVWEGKHTPVRLSRKGDDQRPAEPDRDAAKRTEAALAIWRASQPTKGTLAESYLHSRGL